jgi:hypothetical protein
MTDLERFEAKVERIPFAGCWVWTGASGRRYGRFWLDGDTILAHRASWRLFRGEIPRGSVVCHRCDNIFCVNPDHLFIGSHQDNVDDKVSKGRHARGDTCGKSKLRTEQVLEILASSLSQHALSLRFGVGETAVANIRHGRTWKHLTGER